MPTLSINQRLDALLPKLQDARLLSNRGIGNEIGFYIFDYDAEYEPLVQKYVERLKRQLMSPPTQLILLEIDLYRTILDILQERGVLKKALELEATKGNAALAKTVAPLVRPDQVIAYIQKKLRGDEQLVIMTGVGASWPLLRSHSILNNLHPVLDKIPLVMFFPGSYDGHELRLFDTFKDDNYYRAFPLIPHQQHHL
jgi:ribosomal protein S12